MHITVHGPNQTSVTTKYLKVFFSYDTPVAIIRLPVLESPHGAEALPQRVIVTEKKHSNTTSKHINGYCSLYEGDSSKWTRATQEYIDEVVDSI